MVAVRGGRTHQHFWVWLKTALMPPARGKVSVCSVLVLGGGAWKLDPGSSLHVPLSFLRHTPEREMRSMAPTSPAALEGSEAWSKTIFNMLGVRTSMGTTGFPGNEEEAESPDPLGVGGVLLSAANLSRLMTIGPGLKGSSGVVGVAVVVGVTMGVAGIVVGVAGVVVVGLFSSYDVTSLRLLSDCVDFCGCVSMVFSGCVAMVFSGCVAMVFSGCVAMVFSGCIAMVFSGCVAMVFCGCVAMVFCGCVAMVFSGCVAMVFTGCVAMVFSGCDVMVFSGCVAMIFSGCVAMVFSGCIAMVLVDGSIYTVKYSSLPSPPLPSPMSISHYSIIGREEGWEEG